MMEAMVFGLAFAAAAEFDRAMNRVKAIAGLPIEALKAAADFENRINRVKMVTGAPDKVCWHIAELEDTVTDALRRLKI